MVIRFFVSRGPIRIVRRVEDDDNSRTEIFRDRGYVWEDAGSIFLEISGIGGITEYEEMTLEQARQVMGHSIPEHFTRADDYLFSGLPKGAVKSAIKDSNKFMVY